MSSLVNFIVMADLHWGAIDPNVFTSELRECLFKPLEHKKDPIDFIVISGDTFDMKEYFSSDVVRSALKFFNELSKHTDKIFVIEGTRTHDAYQTLTLKTIFESLVNTDKFVFMEKVSEITYQGIDMLFIPEEYVVDVDSYYGDFFSKHYDFIFGHGMVDKIWYAQKADSKMRAYHAPSAPIFEVDKLCSIANYVYFGHVHTHIAYGPKKRFKYIGPVTRWEFDKEDDCGYYKVTYSNKTELAIEEFIVNDTARVLSTMAVNIDHDMNTSEIDKLFRSITSKLENCYKLRLIINILTDIQSYASLKEIILSRLNNYPMVYTVLKPYSNSDKSEKIAVETNEERAERISRYVEMPEELRIQKFILEKSNINIPLDTIREVTGLNKLKQTDTEDKNEESD